MSTTLKQLKELAAILLLWGLVAVAFAGHNYLTFAADGRRVPLFTAIWWSMAEWFPWVVLTPGILRLVRANRPARGSLAKVAVVLVLAGVGFAVAQVFLEYLLDRLAVLVSGDPGVTVRVWLAGGVRGPALDLSYLLPRKIGFSYVTYWAVVVTALAIEYHRLFVERDVRAARLEGALLGAQLESLQAQLHPHFLFNTLNSIASLIPDNPTAAEETVESLSELLRASLREAGRREIPLGRELELLDLYLSIQATRFQGRLRVRRTLDPALEDAMVPPMLLQPLVENAIRHGIAARGGGGMLEIRARVAERGLELVIEDDGPGFPSDGSHATGIGIANTRARLERLYGGKAYLEVGNRPGGGGIARIRLPLTIDRAPIAAEEPAGRVELAS